MSNVALAGRGIEFDNFVCFSEHQLVDCDTTVSGDGQCSGPS